MYETEIARVKELKGNLIANKKDLDDKMKLYTNIVAERKAINKEIDELEAIIYS